MSEQEINELRISMRAAVAVLKNCKSVIEDCRKNYDSVEFKADKWDKKALAVVEDIDVLLLKVD